MSDHALGIAIRRTILHRHPPCRSQYTDAFLKVHILVVINMNSLAPLNGSVEFQSTPPRGGRLSRDTADKQAGRLPDNPGHPEVIASDYAKAQRILINGEVFTSDRGAVRFIEEDNEIWMISFKKSKNGQETHLTSLRRGRARDLRAERRRLGARHIPARP